LYGSTSSNVGFLNAEGRARGVGLSTRAREVLSERRREIRRAQIYKESTEAGRRYRGTQAAGEDVEFDLDPLVGEGMAAYEGTVGGTRP